MKQIIKRGLVVGGNCTVALMLALNLSQLYRAQLAGIASLDQQILSAHPEQVLENIRSNIPSPWLWALSWAGLAVALFIVIGWCFPRLRNRLWFWWLSLIWLWLWIFYFFATIVLLAVLLNSLF
jgi:hypothetical protein